MSTLDETIAIIRDHFHCPEVPVNETTIPPQVPGWTPHSCLVLLMKLEVHFGVELPTDGLFRLMTVGELVARLDDALAAQAADSRQDQRRTG